MFMSQNLYKFLKLYVLQTKKTVSILALNSVGPLQGLPQGLKGSLLGAY